MSYEEFVRVYAEQFYEENHFGYDQPDGDGILLVDNWYREDDGHIYTWLCTTGKVKDKYSDAAVDHILDNVYRYVERDPYRAYKTYVNDFYHDMLGIQVFHLYVPDSAPWIAGLIAAVIFIICNRKSKKGTKTTTAVTYVAGAQPQFRVKEDRFLRKSVVTRRIETGAGHGGGGGGGGGGVPWRWRPQPVRNKNTSHDGRKCFYFLSIIISRVTDYAILFTARARRDTFLAEVFLW